MHLELEVKTIMLINILKLKGEVTEIASVEVALMN